MSKFARWESFWSEQRQPHHRRDDESHFRELAQEIQLCLRCDVSDMSTLDLGCGNGAMYGPMGFAESKYLGVDYSENMLDQFSVNHPGIELERGNAIEYRHGTRKFDLIFTNGVVCYMTADDFRRSLVANRDLLEPGGLIFHGTIPNTKFRTAFTLGRPPCLPAGHRSRATVAKAVVSELVLRRSSMQWWNPAKLHKIAVSEGFSVEFFGSVLYPYRFHVVMRRSQ